MLPFFSNNLTNANCLISIWHSTSKSILMIPYNFFYVDILNKKSLVAHKEWSTSLGFGREANKQFLTVKNLLRNVKGSHVIRWRYRYTAIVNAVMNFRVPLKAENFMPS